MADYAIGSIRIVEWYDVIGYVTINLSRDNGSTWEHIVEHYPSAGEFEVPDTYNWTVTGPTATNCLIRIIDESDDSTVATSETFSITEDVSSGSTKSSASTNSSISSESSSRSSESSRSSSSSEVDNINDLDTQTISGIIYNFDGTASKNLLIEVRVPFGLQTLQNVSINNKRIVTTTDIDGYFELELVKGLTCTIEGYYSDEYKFFSKEIIVTEDDAKDISSY